MGIPLLRLDATVALVPAEIASPPAAPHEPRARASARSSGLPLTRSGSAAHGLVEAVRSLNEGSELLGQVRRNGS
jgi:hypothetical protein